VVSERLSQLSQGYQPIILFTYKTLDSFLIVLQGNLGKGEGFLELRDLVVEVS